MKRTLTLLSTVTREEYKQLTLEEISELYKNNLYPCLLAEAFIKLYKLMIQVSRGYYGLSEEDIASYATEKLDYCLINYSKDVQAKFSTYFTTVFKNKLRTETESLALQKRKVLYNSTSYEALVEEGFDAEAEQNDDIEIVDIIHKNGLTDKEQKYCHLIMQKYTNTEIVDIMGVSAMTLCNIRKRLRVKLVI